MPQTLNAISLGLLLLQLQGTLAVPRELFSRPRARSMRPVRAARFDASCDLSVSPSVAHGCQTLKPLLMSTSPNHVQ